MAKATRSTPQREHKGGKPVDKSWHPKFLQSFSKLGIVSVAAKLCGIDRGTAYLHRKNDPEFAAQWDEAEADACDVLEAEAVRRATEGMDRSDRLLIFLLGARNPQRFSQRHQLEHSAGQGGMQINLVTATPPPTEDKPDDPEE